ncbi:hypothetical protein BHF71_08515 [Vulcanibacillus modesticaldus]|uniref:RDD domain-containing protein n=1 Tax=Vulcanibacillus modesticaldus TaxID=337097 RepID=A0A1D2YV51_9BACI|nr:RDD family protein [Vulcanibacillus modesticaldus]OEF99580.1 hypothetical protein BHF71_08515 [Vulcanibacillus modesticaldus]
MYAGFWKRFFGYFIDSIVILLGEIILIFFLAVIEMIFNKIGIEQTIKENILVIIGLPLYISWPWLYYAVLESSRIQATLGKKVLQLIVVDIYNNRISFARASARYWSKVISAAILLIGFFMAGFTKEKRALHDIIAGTYVINKSHEENVTLIEA